MTLISDRSEAAALILCVVLQLASVGTFQVLKLPLGFIRVLEWVSWNLTVCACSHFTVRKCINSLLNRKVVCVVMVIRFKTVSLSLVTKFLTSVVVFLAPALSCPPRWETLNAVYSVPPWLHGSRLCYSSLTTTRQKKPRCSFLWMPRANNVRFAPVHKNAPFYPEWNQSLITFFCLAAVCRLWCLFHSAEKPRGKKR